jgi:hypothetical protein
MNTNNTIRSGFKGRGSALILVVVVTVLLAMVGIMFLMVSRVGDMMGTGSQQEYQLDQAVGTVTTRIERILMQDLFGNGLDKGIIDGKGGVNESYDAPGTADPWLASLEPVFFNDNGTPDDPTDDLYQWPYISNIVSSLAMNVNFGDRNWDRILRDGTSTWATPRHGGIVQDYQEASSVIAEHPADADGDGVADSVWVPMGQTGGGEMVYAAVRIIDNCAMLNLNTAHMTRKASAWTGQGRWLGEVDYERFLRGTDRAVPDVVRKARLITPPNPAAANDLFDVYHDNVIMKIENPGPAYTLFDLNDELEIRNRFLLTSLAQARFERVTRSSAAPYQYGMYETFDFGRGFFPADKKDPDDRGGNDFLRVGRIPYEKDTFYLWKMRMDSINLDDSSPWNSNPYDYMYYYDRRHVCTFYSFDRNLRWGGDPALNTWTVAERDQYEKDYKKIFTPGDGRAVSVRADILSNTIEARRNILHLLYGFRAYYLSKNDPLPTAARKAAQIVANMIDYLDDSANTQTGPFGSALFGSQYNERPTYITRQIINRMIAEISAYIYNNEDPSVPFYPEPAIPAVFDFGMASGDVVYGFERQPFISELYVVRDNSNNTVDAAIELVNPYDSSLSVANWRIVFNRISASTPFTISSGTTMPAASSSAPSRLVIRSASSVPVTGTAVTLAGFGMNTLLADANSIDLQRPDPRDSNYATNPTQYITVDRIPKGQIQLMLTDNPADGLPTLHALKRQDSGWKFTNANAAIHQQAVPPAASPATLGTPNGITVTQSGWQMPVADLNPISADRKFFTLGDFQKVLFIGNQGGSDPNTVTSAVAAASGEGDIRFDIVENPELLGFICFLNRPQGSLPGRININTAPKHVLTSAILSAINASTFDQANPIAQTYAQAIVNGRTTTGFANLGSLLNLPQWNIPAAPFTGDDTSISGDLQERDWLLGNLSNIFTARSDVFTAYILVRLGQNGPQRRVMAIFDRSQVWTPEDRPRIVAIKTVPNPR